MFPLLESITSPADLRQLEPAQLHTLAGEIREFLLESVSERPASLSTRPSLSARRTQNPHIIQ